MNMDIKRMETLIKRDEGTKLDFKQRIELELESGRKELAKDVCAIANSRGGRGYIVIGVEDKTKRIIGMEGNTYTEEQIQQIISSRCEPPIPIVYETVDYLGKNLYVITIYDGGQKPYQIRENGAFYIRRGSTTDVMRKQEIAAALQENLALNVELCPIIQSSPSSLDYDLIDKYFSFHRIDVNEENRNMLMENASIIRFDKDLGRYVVTLGGILIFSDKSSVYIPHNMIRIVNRTNKNEKSITIVKGNLLAMLNECEEFLEKHLPQAYPIEAVVEAVNNAVLHRDYTIFNKEIEIVISNENIIVVSPGILIKGKDISNQNYAKRNMWIYEKFIAIDNKKRFMKSNRGFSMMKQSFKNIGKVIFINSLNGDYFKVVLPGTGKFES
jgi:predicted HTH transcriptional regulator